MSGKNLQNLSVLYVEDEAAPREETALFLKRRIKKLVTATNGEEGLARFHEERPDLVVTDIRLPVMDGLQMVRAMRSEYKGIPIIVTTAYTEAPYMTEAIDIAVDQYVIKPIDTDKLSVALEKCAETIEYRTAHKRFLAERELLIKDLQKALSEIKTLRGILPICSSCKKIRDDEGSWEQIESYIRDHSEAEFSHGLCPECANRMREELKQLKPHTQT